MALEVMACRCLPRPGLRLSKQFVRPYSARGDGTIPPAKQKYVPTSGDYPLGFRVSSAHVGVKASNTRFDDLAFITSDLPCQAAGTFTRNVFQAAPVVISKQRLGSGATGIRGIIINSGCANALTGKPGLDDARRMCAAADSALGLEPSSETGTVVMSTGVIGQRLPIDKILLRVPIAAASLGSNHENWLRAARAICTTDTFPKLISRRFKLPGLSQAFTLTGMTKGAGMIHPNMGTLLSVICTDTPIEAETLREALVTAVNASFNSISIDGDTSTNDTVVCLANGAAMPNAGPEGQDRQWLIDVSEQEMLAAFQKELTQLCEDLAKLIVRDGEGATKFVTIRVKGAASQKAGHAIAKTIAKSPLVKTALYGQDANWGRILCAIGYSPSEADVPQGQIIPEKTSVSFVPNATSAQRGDQELKLLIDGEPQDIDEQEAARMLAEEDLEILVRLRPESESQGTTEVTYWTCDFSHEYVTINGDYRT